MNPYTLPACDRVPQDAKPCVMAAPDLAALQMRVAFNELIGKVANQLMCSEQDLSMIGDHVFFTDPVGVTRPIGRIELVFPDSPDYSITLQLNFIPG